MYKYVVIFSRLLDERYIIFDKEKKLKKFLKYVLGRYPGCHIQIFKSIEMEVSDFYGSLF